MKISNSKKELARIINENGGWRDGAQFSAQDKDGEVFHYAAKPSIYKCSEVWGHKGCIGYGEFPAKTLPNWHQTILSRDEYFYLHPAPDAKHEFCESVMRSIPEPSDKPTIEQLAADYRNAKDYAERKQQEADAAKADAEAKLVELVAAGKALGLVLSVADAPEPELVITDWRDLRDGDEVECISPNVSPNKYRGRIGRLIGIDEHDSGTPYLVDFGECAKIWCHKVKFIRRP